VNFVALKMLTGDRAKYLGLIITIAFASFALENEASIFAGNHERAKAKSWNWGRSSQMCWIRFTAEFIGVKSEEPAECPRYLRDHVLEEVRS